jgi:hypothetical protein
MSGHHHPISPSKFEILLNCSGSYELSKQAPASAFKSTVESAEGTMLHALTEEQLAGYIKTGKVVEQAIGSKYTFDGFEFTFTAEHRESIRASMRYIFGLIEQYDVDHKNIKLETRVEIPTNWENFFPADGPISGRLDLQIVIPFQALIIIDHKYGKGVKVNVVDNLQLLGYALGAWLALSEIQRETIEEIHLVVNQPRHYAGPDVQTWVIGPERLAEFHRELLNGTQRIIDKDYTLNPGSWCRWCPAHRALICEADKNYSLSLVPSAANDFKSLQDTPKLPPAKALTNEQLGAIVCKRKPFYAYMESCENEALDRELANPGCIPGVGSKPKRSNRKIFDEEAVKSFFYRNDFEDDFYLRTGLKTITDLEANIKVFEKEHGKLKDHARARLETGDMDNAPEWKLSDYIHKPDNGKTLKVDGE